VGKGKKREKPMNFKREREAQKKDYCYIPANKKGIEVGRKKEKQFEN